MKDAQSANAWPAIGTEEIAWHGSPRYWSPASGRSNEGQTYSSAIPAEIATLTPQPSSEVSALAESATYELSRFDAELGSRIAEFAPILLRSEAVSSSQIENLTASARAVLSAELGARPLRNAGQIVANTRTLAAALRLADSITVDSILTMHRVLMEEAPRHTPGEWRTEAVWIGTRSDSPVGAEFVAPAHARVPASDAPTRSASTYARRARRHHVR